MNKKAQTFKIEKHLLRLPAFLPALVIMYLIVGFSSQDAQASGKLSSQLTCRIVSFCSQLLGQDPDEEEIMAAAARLEHGIRKAAHMTEYFLLALSLALPLALLWKTDGRRLLLRVVLFCFLFAALDEFHQSFVPGRSPSFRDVLIDTAGSLAGTCAARLLLKVFYALSRIRHS